MNSVKFDGIAANPCILDRPLATPYSSWTDNFISRHVFYWISLKQMSVWLRFPSVSSKSDKRKLPAWRVAIDEFVNSQLYFQLLDADFSTKHFLVVIKLHAIFEYAGTEKDQSSF